MSRTSASTATVDLSAYAHNLAIVRKYISQRPDICAVVKANAYGHGALPMAEKAIACGIRSLAVATVDEGIELRTSGIDVPLYIMVPPGKESLAAAAEFRLTFFLADVDTAEALGEIASRANRVIPIHCMIDTGFSRQGFPFDQALHDLQYLTRISHIDIEGIATHFPVADKVEDPFTYNQIKQFRQLLKQLDKSGIPYERAHAANSAAIINYPSSTLDMVRPGLMTYGIWPVETPPQQQILRPVLRWETHVIQVKALEPGSSIGYGRTYTTAHRMRAAILPVGYADGYKHSLSNKGVVLIRGQRCPVRGSVCMDQVVVDVSHLDRVEVGDIVTLIGADGGERITAEELAKIGGTIPYEIVTGISARVPRVYVDEAGT
ncbi:MAG: alanine racemase [Candidatus Hydrogenedentes bacterium]|nr:alanine racemase [Candidatus Hydrogenedentota bacterium]